MISFEGTPGAQALGESALAGASPRALSRARSCPFSPRTTMTGCCGPATAISCVGEDSFVRAQWAARPLVWQAYPQDGNAHAIKTAGFLDRYLRPPRDASAAWTRFGERGTGSRPAGTCPAPGPNAWTIATG